MEQFNKISEEELAAYLEGMLSEQEASQVEKMVDIDTFEVLSVSRKALEQIPADNIVPLPSWDKVEFVSVRPLHEPLAMAGFLGESNVDENFEEEPEDDSEQ